MKRSHILHEETGKHPVSARPSDDRRSGALRADSRSGPRRNSRLPPALALSGWEGDRHLLHWKNHLLPLFPKGCGQFPRSSAGDPAPADRRIEPDRAEMLRKAAGETIPLRCGNPAGNPDAPDSPGLETGAGNADAGPSFRADILTGVRRRSSGNFLRRSSPRPSPRSRRRHAERWA